MKRIQLLVTAIIFPVLFSCAPTKNTAPPKETEVPEAVLTPDTPPGVLSMNYIDAASALAADDMDKAKASLKALAEESTGELKTLAEKAANTGQIAATREAFKALSALAITLELPEGYAVVHCPMYRGGAKWVQKRDKLANPYFGKTMLTCGTFVN